MDFAPLSIEAGKSLAFTGPEAPCEIFGMPLALREALGNLIHNGLQHSGLGDCVEVEVQAPATIVVSNRGPAVPDDVLSRIFEPFFTTRAGCGGSGLGLTVVDAIAKSHGGSVAVRSANGTTEFVIMLGSGGESGDLRV